jgi:hypothetical protein
VQVYHITVPCIIPSRLVVLSDGFQPPTITNIKAHIVLGSIFKYKDLHSRYDLLQLLIKTALKLPLLKEAHETFFALCSLCQFCDNLLDRRAMLQKLILRHSYITGDSQKP